LDFKALLCLALFVAFQLFASSGALHRCLHPDSGDPQHACALTMWTHGQANLGGGMAPLVLLAALILFLLPSLTETVLPGIDCRLYFGRGPPSCQPFFPVV